MNRLPLTVRIAKLQRISRAALRAWRLGDYATANVLMLEHSKEVTANKGR